MKMGKNFLLKQGSYNFPSQRKHSDPNARKLDLAHKVIKAFLGKGCNEEIPMDIISADRRKIYKNVWIVINITKCICLEAD